MKPDARRALWTAIAAACRTIAGPVLPLPAPGDLRYCPACGRDRIAVLECSLRAPGPGMLHLRCGECAHTWQRVATTDEARELRALHAAQRQEMKDALAGWDPDGRTRELDALLRRHSP